MESCDILVRHASELVTLRGPTPRIGPALDDAAVIEDGSVAIRDGRIVGVGGSDELRRQFSPRVILDAQQCAVVPGFVDAHTHPVFARTREVEFEMRLHGRTYQEITAAGGGIFSSVRALREASTPELETLVKTRFDRFVRAGTTTIEAKSGYGLNLEDELRSLEILKRVAATHPLEVISTYLGAHQMPEEYRDRRDDYIDFMIREALPEVRRRDLASACDVFCDEGAYTVEESTRFLRAAKEQGFELRVHADELKGLGAAEMAAALGARSADHLCRISDAGIDALRAAGTTAMLLPGTVLSLGAKAIPPARRMIEAGVIVAIATDFNPGTSFIASMPVCIAIACTLLRMTPAEALAAATINAAWSLGIADRVGSIEVGKQADLVILDRPSYLFLPYELGQCAPRLVMKAGRTVFERPEIPVSAE